jgi:hypothetical protein
VPFDRDLVEVGGLGGVVGLEGDVIDDEDVDADEPARFGVVGVVEAGGFDAFEQPVGAFGVDLVAVAAGDVAERVREVGLADRRAWSWVGLRGDVDDGLVGGSQRPAGLVEVGGDGSEKSGDVARIEGGDLVGAHATTHQLQRFDPVVQAPA